MFKKKLINLFLAGSILFTGIFAPAVSAKANEWKQLSPGVYRMLDGSSITGIFARGIDVSHWQGDIDWKAVSNDDVKFVMHGTRYKGNIDPKFDYNARSAVSNGIKLGAYIYSYAMTVEEADKEADFVLNLIKDYPISYPIAFDVEDSTQGTLPKDELTAIIKTFTTKIRNAGYYPIIYANDYWIANKLDMKALKDLDVWVARYNVKHSFSNPVMWQATSTGKVNGIKGNTDIDFQYVDFSSKIPANTWRIFDGTYYYYKDYIMQKSAWILDNNKWYYLSHDGKMFTGWLNDSGKKYYLEDNGAMKVGFGTIDNKNYFFKGDGSLATAWINTDGAWFYADKDGILQKGWLSDSGKKYYLEDNGAMKVGFGTIDNKNYFFKGDGSLATAWINTDGAWFYAGKDGILQKGWIKVADKWYYLNEQYIMQTGFITLGNDTYYLSSKGDMQVGVVNIDGNLYSFTASGSMQRNTEITYNNEVYTIGADGIMIKKPTETQAEQPEATNSTSSEAPVGTVIDTNNAPQSNNSANLSAPSGSGSAHNQSENTNANSGPGVKRN